MTAVFKTWHRIAAYQITPLTQSCIMSSWINGNCPGNRKWGYTILIRSLADIYDTVLTVIVVVGDGWNDLFGNDGDEDDGVDDSDRPRHVERCRRHQTLVRWRASVDRWL